MITFVSNLRYTDSKINTRKAAASDYKIGSTNESNWARMTYTGQSFYAATRLCYTSSIVVAGLRWRTNVSTTHGQMYSMHQTIRGSAF
ncbi:hypothetical protein TNCV_561421 [Trichonephila clavipes]|uniref:Uncharacterized protein n=1 Tax=Trichonephila clavipes TaxID=2585209 RepID=A0A8X6S5H6_TRICX|nr:hypothetical protein TNCV_561421 [Trichonephila clavipes]